MGNKASLRSKMGIALAAALVVSGLSVLAVSGSSHNDAPLISEDPIANNTDVYAFVSSSNPNMVTLIANYIPNEEPGNGPTHYHFSDNVLYEIMVDVNGDAREDLTYQFDFQTQVGAVTPNTFLYNTAPITVPSSTSDPGSPYGNLNVIQTYNLIEVTGDRRTGQDTTLLQDARVAPANVGPVSTPDYDSLANAAIHPLDLGDGVPMGQVFAGPRDEGFYVDLMAAFDLFGGLLDPQRDPVDTFSGFNVHTIAVDIPKERLQQAGDTDGIIGVWASSSRQRTRILRMDKPPLNKGNLVQVSRLGMPLTNELLMPFSAKDLFNSNEPKKDVANGFDDFITDPGPSQGDAALIPLINALVTDCTPTSGRIDLALIFLKGIDTGTAGALDDAVPSLAPFTTAGGNQDTQKSGGPVRADMLRLNYNVPPSDSPSSLGFFGGDPAGFPNGRRVGDDVVDVALKGAAGGVLDILGVIDCDVSLTLSDGVQANDVPYADDFPYLGTPHQGYDHNHTHGSGAVVAMSVGSGLLFGGLLLGGVYAIRRRREDAAQVGGQ